MCREILAPAFRAGLDNPTPAMYSRYHILRRQHPYVEKQIQIMPMLDSPLRICLFQNQHTRFETHRFLYSSQAVRDPYAFYFAAAVRAGDRVNE